jgi:hypothetical protein
MVEGKLAMGERHGKNCASDLPYYNAFTSSTQAVVSENLAQYIDCRRLERKKNLQ